MASDEVGVELGVDTVDRCKLALQEAEELQVIYLFTVHFHFFFRSSLLSSLLPFFSWDPRRYAYSSKCTCRRSNNEVSIRLFVFCQAKAEEEAALAQTAVAEERSLEEQEEAAKEAAKAAVEAEKAAAAAARAAVEEQEAVQLAGVYVLCVYACRCSRSCWCSVCFLHAFAFRPLSVSPGDVRLPQVCNTMRLAR